MMTFYLHALWMLPEAKSVEIVHSGFRQQERFPTGSRFFDNQ
jgi:hypothetical protein